MNERQERIERLAVRWLEAQTSEAEERELRALLRGDDLPESLRGWAVLFEDFEALSEEALPEQAAGRLPVQTADRQRGEVVGCLSEDTSGRLSGEEAGCLSEMPVLSQPASTCGRSEGTPGSRSDDPAGSRRRGTRLRRVLFWSAAAAGVVLGVLLGVKLLRQPYCYIDGKPVYDKELALRTTTYFEAFEVLDAPDRLVDQLIDNH